MRAIGYVRVSTTDQAQDGLSLDAQAARIEAACVARGWTLVELVRDEGYSAKDTHRPGLQRILEAGKTRKGRAFDTVLIVKLDRLTRSVRDLADMLEAFQAWKLGLVSIEETIDTKSATGELFLNIIASVSQWERKVGGERTRSVLGKLRGEGRRYSRVLPYGYCLDHEGRYVPCPQEQATLVALAGLAGVSLRAAGRRLLELGHRPRTGETWRPSTLLKLRARLAG